MKLEPRAQTTPSMHTQQHPLGLEGTHWRWLGEYTSTDVKENTANLSYAPNVNPHSQTHTYSEAVDPPQSSEPNSITIHSDYYSNAYRTPMEDDDPYYARAWAIINQSPT
jgi:hypothetical protein